MPKKRKYSKNYPPAFQGVVRRLRARGIMEIEIKEIVYGTKLSKGQKTKLIKFVEANGSGSFKKTNGTFKLTPVVAVEA